jgi:hypothetical protein
MDSETASTLQKSLAGGSDSAGARLSPRVNSSITRRLSRRADGPDRACACLLFATRLPPSAAACAEGSPLLALFSTYNPQNSLLEGTELHRFCQMLGKTCGSAKFTVAFHSEPAQGNRRNDSPILRLRLSSSSVPEPSGRQISEIRTSKAKASATLRACATVAATRTSCPS